MYIKNAKYQRISNNKKIVIKKLNYLKIIPDYLKRKKELKLIRDLIKKKKFKIENSIIISSETRSGSTWLMEMLNTSTDIISNWESLHPSLGVITKKSNLGDRPYILENEKNQNFKNEFDNLLTLNKINYWTSSFIDIDKLANSKQVLTKFVRANMLMPWLTSEYKFKKKPILLLRHPVATTLSQIKSFDLSNNGDIKYKAPNCYNNDRYKENENYLNSLDSLFERKIALWCINNIPTINHNNSGIKWKVIYYENLMLNPREEVKKISNILELNLDIEKIDFDKKSSSSKKSDISKNSHIENWTKAISKEDKLKVQRIFDYYNLNIYTAYNPYPK
jgi:Sulfotransferase domain